METKTRQSTTTRTIGSFLSPGAPVSVGTLDLADRWGGFTVMLGMMLWSIGRVIPDEFLWNMQAARSVTPWV
jgi:hypothetical protein